MKRKIYWLIVKGCGRCNAYFHFLSCHYVWSADGGGQKCTRLLITIFLDWNSWTMATRPTFTIPDKTRQLFFISSSYAPTLPILKSLGPLLIYSQHTFSKVSAAVHNCIYRVSEIRHVCLRLRRNTFEEKQSLSVQSDLNPTMFTVMLVARILFLASLSLAAPKPSLPLGKDVSPSHGFPKLSLKTSPALMTPTISFQRRWKTKLQVCKTKTKINNSESNDIIVRKFPYSRTFRWDTAPFHCQFTMGPFMC